MASFSDSAPSAPAEAPVQPRVLSPGLDVREQVVVELAALRQTLASRCDVTPAQIQRWERLYSEAGRAALAAEERD